MNIGGALALTLALAACGGRAPAPAAPAPAEPTAAAPAEPAPMPAEPAAPPKDLLPEQVEVIVRGYETVASAAGPATACGAVADRIADVATSTATARAAVSAASRGERAADVDALMVAAGPRLGPAVAAIDAAATRCTSEPRVARALESLDR